MEVHISSAASLWVILLGGKARQTTTGTLQRPMTALSLHETSEVSRPGKYESAAG